jgi:uncharacterized membrane protein YcaP (DUF421 family)
MGKRQIAQMQPYELVITLIIADLATIPMADVSIPLMQGITPLVVLTILHYIISILSCKSIKWRNFINGRPVVIINPDGVQAKALKELNMNMNDLLEACRIAGYYNLCDIQYGIIETNGNLSIIPKPGASQVTRDDMNIKTDDNRLNFILISHGKFSEQNLKILKISKDEIIKLLISQNIKNINNILILTYNKDGKLYLQEIDKKYKILNKHLGE